MGVFERSEKSIFAGNEPLDSEHLCIMNAFEWVPIVPILKRFYCKFFSKLISFYHLNTSPNAFKGTFPKMLLQDLRELPIPEASKSKRNEIVNNVDLLLKLNEDLKSEKLQSKIEQIKTCIEHSEEKINQLVYELYELTADEIAIVENTN